MRSRSDIERLGEHFGQDPISYAGHWALMAAPDWLADDLVHEANTGDKLALYWIERLVASREKRNDSLRKRELVRVYRDLSETVKGIRGKSEFAMNARTGACGWVFLAPEDDSFPDIETVYALKVSRIIGAELLGGIKRCVQKEERGGKHERCRNFFFSMRRRKYCMTERCERDRERTRKAKNRG